MVEVIINRQVEVIERMGDPQKILQSQIRRKIYPTELPDVKRLRESNQFALKQDTVKEGVKSILRTDMLARTDYWWLEARYYAKYGFLKEVIILPKYKEKPSPGSIGRAKRQLYIEARAGKPELQYLLKDQEFLEKMQKQEELYHDYYQDKRNSKIAEIVK